MSKLNLQNRISRLLARILVLGLIFACFLCSLFTANAAGNGIMTLTLNQTLTVKGDETPPGDTFTYRLTPKKAGYPMPGGGSEFTFTAKGTGESSIGDIRFTARGVYTYEIRNITPAELGYTYDDQVFTVEVHVGSDLSIGAVIGNSNNEKSEGIHFDHEFQVLYEGDLAPAEYSDSSKPKIFSPITGDMGRFLLWILIISVSAMLMMLIIIVNKKSRYE